RHSNSKNLKIDTASAFELQHLARVARRSDGEAELLENPPRLRDLGSIRFGELPAAEPQAVLEADAHVAAHHRRHRGDEHLVAAGAQDRPVVSVAEQACGAALCCGRNCLYAAGSWVGLGSFGLRACGCTIAAPACAAPSAAAAISSGGSGRYGDMLSVWSEPVAAHVMTTLPCASATCE